MPLPPVCAHLSPVLDGLLGRGAAVAREEKEWSKAKLVVVLDKGPGPAAAQAEASARGLKFWRNDDAHYSLEFGLFCEEHAQGLSWPQDAADLP